MAVKTRLPWLRQWSNDEFKILSDESLAVIAWMVLKLLIF